MTSRLGKTLRLAAGLGFVAAPSAHAALILAATVGGVPICAVDQNAFICGHGTPILDTSPTIGTLSLGGAPVLIGGLSFSGSTHTSIFGPANNSLTTSSLIIVNTTAAPIAATFAVSQTGFTPPVTTDFTSGSGTWLSAAGSTIRLEWWNDPANAQGAETPGDRPGGLVDAFDFLVSAPVDSHAHVGGPFAVADPAAFSMTVAFEFTLAPGGQLTSQGQAELKPVAVITLVPEPTPLALLGIALAAFGITRQRKNA